jgi:competence protein ComEC
MCKPSVLFVATATLLGCLPGIPDDYQTSGAPAGANPSPGTCGSGTWQAGWLEIHHIDAGEGVSTLIVSPVGRSLLIDAGEADWDRDDGAKLVGAYVGKVLGCTRLDYVVVSHFHVDHVGFPGHGGLWHLVAQQGFSVGKLLHRDLYRYAGTSATSLGAWRALLQGADASSLAPEIATLGRGQVELGGGVEFAFVAVDGGGLLPVGDFSADAAPPDENDYSIAALLRFGRLDYFTAGDLSGETLVASQGGYAYHDGETALAPWVKDVDVYRASHHGSSHASNVTLLAELDPEVAIVQVGDANPNGHPSQSTIDRLVARSAVYLTEHGEPGTDLRTGKVVGDVVLRSANGSLYTVAGDPFIATDPRRVDSDGDGYFVEADPDDGSPLSFPAPNGGCDSRYQVCP